jgi:hypothetical protein
VKLLGLLLAQGLDDPSFSVAKVTAGSIRFPASFITQNRSLSQRMTSETWT